MSKINVGTLPSLATSASLRQVNETPAEKKPSRPLPESLVQLGWARDRQREFNACFNTPLEPGRVVEHRRQHYIVETASGHHRAQVVGRLLHDADGTSELPAIGDWVAVQKNHDSGAMVHAVLTRSSKLSRKVAGRKTEEQVAAANVDVVLLVMGLDGDFNLRRLERFLVSAWESGARPMVVFNKADLSNDPASRQAAAENVAPGVSIHLVSCVSGMGIDTLLAALPPGQTVVFLGASGAGKSTLLNRLLGLERMRTGAVRSGDDRGRHTTTHRELVRLPNGALLIDSPGIRELQLWNANAGVEDTFDDIQELAKRCRFRDCTHHAEPGCAVRASVTEGRLEAARLDHLHQLERELQALALRQSSAARRKAGKKAQAMYRSAKRAKDSRKRW